jgi:hypothetical protein
MPRSGAGPLGESHGRHGVQTATRPLDAQPGGTSAAASCWPQKTKFSPVFPRRRPTLQRHAGRITSTANTDGNATRRVRVRGARALLGVRLGAPGAPEYDDAECYERHPDDVVQVDAVATAREVKDDDVPAVRVKANYGRPSEDCNHCQGSAQHARRGYAAITSGRSSSGTYGCRRW